MAQTLSTVTIGELLSIVAEAQSKTDIVETGKYN